MQSLEEGIFSVVAYADMGQERVVHLTNGMVISLKRQAEYKERVDKSTVTKCVDFFRGWLKRSFKRNTSTVSNPTQNATTTPTSHTNSVPIADRIIEEEIRDDTMVDELSDVGEGQELGGMTGFADEDDTDDGYDGGFDDMGMFSDDEDIEMDRGVGDGRNSRSYQTTGTHKADNATADTTDSIHSTPTPEYSSPDRNLEPDDHEHPYLTPSPESNRKQSTTSNPRNLPPRSLRTEPATPPSSPSTTLSNNPHRMNNISNSSHIDTYDPKEGLKVFWDIEQVKTRYAQRLEVETLTARHREEVRRFGNEVLSLIILRRIVTSVDTKFVDILFNGYFF